MSYRLAKIKPHDLARIARIPILKQEDIVSKFGSPLVPTLLYSVVKDKSDNFTKSDPLLEQADSELSRFLEAKGFYIKDEAEKTGAAVVSESVTEVEQRKTRFISFAKKFDKLASLAKNNPRRRANFKKYADNFRMIAKYAK